MALVAYSRQQKHLAFAGNQAWVAFFSRADSPPTIPSKYYAGGGLSIVVSGDWSDIPILSCVGE